MQASQLLKVTIGRCKQITALCGDYLPVIAASEGLGVVVGDLWTAGSRYSLLGHCDCSAHHSV